MTESEATDLDQRPPSADYVLDLLSEYEDTHDSIADRLLGRLVGVNPAVALEHLEATKAHLDKRLVRSAAAPDTIGYDCAAPGPVPPGGRACDCPNMMSCQMAAPAGTPDHYADGWSTWYFDDLAVQIHDDGRHLIARPPNWNYETCPECEQEPRGAQESSPSSDSERG